MSNVKPNKWSVQLAIKHQVELESLKAWAAKPAQHVPTLSNTPYTLWSRTAETIFNAQTYRRLPKLFTL